MSEAGGRRRRPGVRAVIVGVQNPDQTISLAELKGILCAATTVKTIDEAFRRILPLREP